MTTDELPKAPNLRIPAPLRKDARKLIGRVIDNAQTRRDRWVLTQSKQVPNGAKVLDIGAGGAPYRAFFGHCIYKTQDSASLRNDQLVEGRYTQVDYVCDATSVPVADGSIDVVLCTEVLEHVPEPLLLIKEIARLLKPGGLLILTAPLGSGIHQEPLHFYGGYTPYFYERVLRGHGFRYIQIEANEGSFAHFGQWCLWFMKSCFSHFLRERIFVARVGFLFAFLVCSLPLALIYGLSRLLDRYDLEQRFTTGYHVLARK